VDALREVLRQAPSRVGLPRTRWRLADLRQALPALATYSLPGLSQLLTRLGVRRSRGRVAVHSPDPAYQTKLRWIERARALAVTHPERVRLLYADEAHLQRQPSLAPLYAWQGEEPLARMVAGPDYRQRYAGALDLVSGQVTWLTGHIIGVDRLKGLLRKVRTRYPDEQLFVVWDNWPVHQHPAVLEVASMLRIELLWLPTYAPWTNPIEKLWRWLRQEVVHQHRLADQWPTLKAQVAAFLDRFAHGSEELLRYVGLLPV
jgi:transposase